MAVAIDTLAYARKLRDAGFSEQQAEGQAEALAAAMTDTLATKVDLQALATRQDLERFATKQDLERFATKQDLERFATKQDLERFATRQDLLELERRMDLKLDARIADLERRMTMRLGGLMVAGIGFMSALQQWT